MYFVVKSWVYGVYDKNRVFLFLEGSKFYSQGIKFYFYTPNDKRCSKKLYGSGYAGHCSKFDHKMKSAKP